MNLHIYTDGGARGNPGPAAVGVIFQTEKGQPVGQIAKRIGQATNNVAEYEAVVAALTWLRDHQDKLVIGSADRLSFYLDSMLVVNQLNGIFKLKNANLRLRLFTIRALEQEIGANISYTAVPREKNFAADQLVNQALDTMTDEGKISRH